MLPRVTHTLLWLSVSASITWPVCTPYGQPGLMSGTGVPDELAPGLVAGALAAADPEAVVPPAVGDPPGGQAASSGGARAARSRGRRGTPGGRAAPEPRF